MLMIQVPPADRWSCAEQVARPRLMPNHPDLRFEGRVRETPLPSAEKAGLEVDSVAVRIIRDPSYHDPARKARCAKRDLELVVLEPAQLDGPLPCRLWLAAGEAHSALGAPNEAREAFLRAIEAAQRGSTEMLEGHYGLLTTYDNDKSLERPQLKACLEALQVFPFDAQLLLAMGSYLQRSNRLDLAARTFETAVRYGQINPETWHLTEVAEIAAACLSLTLQMQRKDPDARAVLEEALQQSPGSTRLLRHLIDLHIKHGREADAIDLADRLPTDCGRREPLRNAIRGASRAAQQDFTAALGYLQSAYVTGCNDPICLRWLSVALLSNGQLAAAEPILHQWRQSDPGNSEVQKYLDVLRQEKDAARAPKQGGTGADRDPAVREFRLDQGTTSLDAVPPVHPIISQASSIDPAAPQSR